MKLNLSIVKDGLTDLEPIEENTEPMSPRTLRYPRFYKSGDSFEPGVLYIAHSEELPAQAEIPEETAILCLGFPPSAYNTYCDRIVCYSSSYDKQELFHAAQQVFCRYGEYDEKLKDMIIEDKPMREFGELALEIFRTPATAFGAFEKILFLSYDHERPEGRVMYDSLEDEYWPEDERSILYQSEAFRKSLETHGPAFFETDSYKTQIIFYNFFERENYIGRFMIENTYRPFKDGDYRLVEWFGEYILLLLRRARQYRFSATREFEQMIQELSLFGGKYRPEYDHVLRNFGWKKDDRFLCHAIIADSEGQNTQILNESAFYLEELLDSQYLFFQNHALIQIVDLTQTKLLPMEIERRLNLFLNSNALLAGSSTGFSDFTLLSVYLRQARLMADYALHDRRKKLYLFDEQVLSMLLHNMQGDSIAEVFYTESVKKLMDYDKENGTELAYTLQCYLENDQNVNQTYEKLFIARTTCLYRIRRIQELTHLRLEDPNVTLYLRLALRIGSAAIQRAEMLPPRQ